MLLANKRIGNWEEGGLGFPGAASTSTKPQPHITVQHVNGSKANLCFNRRESGAAKTKAYIDSIESMVERIRYLEKELQGKLKDLTFRFRSHTKT